MTALQLIYLQQLQDCENSPTHIYLQRKKNNNIKTKEVYTSSFSLLNTFVYGFISPSHQPIQNTCDKMFKNPKTEIVIDEVTMQ